MGNIRQNIQKSMSFFLFAKPSLIRDMGRIFDTSGSFLIYNESETPEDADRRAILSDWLMVRDDLQSALEEYERTNTR